MKPAFDGMHIFTIQAGEVLKIHARTGKVSVLLNICLSGFFSVNTWEPEPLPLSRDIVRSHLQSGSRASRGLHATLAAGAGIVYGTKTVNLFMLVHGWENQQERTSEGRRGTKHQTFLIIDATENAASPIMAFDPTGVSDWAPLSCDSGGRVSYGGVTAMAAFEFTRQVNVTAETISSGQNDMSNNSNASNGSATTTTYTTEVSQHTTGVVVAVTTSVWGCSTGPESHASSFVYFADVTNAKCNRTEKCALPFARLLATNHGVLAMDLHLSSSNTLSLYMAQYSIDSKASSQVLATAEFTNNNEFPFWQESGNPQILAGKEKVQDGTKIWTSKPLSIDGTGVPPCSLH